MHLLDTDQAARERAAIPQLAVNVAVLAGRLAPLGLTVDLTDSDLEHYRCLDFGGRTAENADLLRRSGAACLADRRPRVRQRDRQPDRWNYEHMPTVLNSFALHLLTLLPS
jgi:hypothetical protein